MGGSNANLLEEVRATKRDITTAHTTFTTHFNTFLALAEQLEVRLKELEGREGEVEKRENKLKGADQQYDERERNSLAREKKVEERERTVLEMEARWKETEKRMEANAAKLPTIIKLNISMTTSLSFPSTLFLTSSSPSRLFCHHNHCYSSSISFIDFMLSLFIIFPFLSSPFLLYLLLSRWDSICTCKRDSASTQRLPLRADDCLQSFSATLLWRVCHHPSPLSLFSSSPFSSSLSHNINRIFIQRDAKFCHYVIRYFMYGTFQLPTNEVKRKAIEEEFKYFNIPLPGTPTPAPAPFTRLFLPRDSLYVIHCTPLILTLTLIFTLTLTLTALDSLFKHQEWQPC